jgi:hypothetical protein
VAVLGLATGGYVIAQTHRDMRMHRMDHPAMARHLSKVFGEFARFDVDKDGKLDTAEKESLANAIADGSLILPPHAPGKEMFPSEEQRLDHFAEMYARFAVYDANHDGELDSGEEAAVREAIERGELIFPDGKGPGGIHPHRLGKSLHPR